MQPCIILLALALLPILQINGQSIETRTGSDAARPVKRFAGPTSLTSEIDLFSFEFQRPYHGYEGPNFARLDGQPSKGAQYLIKAELFGQQAVATAKFELVDGSGRVIQLLRLSKYITSLDDGKYVGFVEVPSQPFRVMVSGRDTNDAPYRRVYKRLFRPALRPPAPPLVPPGLPSGQAKAIETMLKAMERQAISEMEKRVSKHPDGVIVVPRVEVSGLTYEPYISDSGNTLGIRLRYALRFSADGDYAHSLQVFPDYKDADLRGLVEMQVIKESIDPRPDPPSYATPNIHVDLETLVNYGTQAGYRGGVVYRFLVDLVPDFVGQNATKTKFCVDETHYEQKVKTRQAWEAMKASGALVAYRILMRQVDYAGHTEPSRPPKTFYEGFLREGVVPCKPYKNIHF
ncbi:MAG: hypothetical protein AABN95_25195 [Acidobacteriota bacterium]